jgi:hypothetical protein
VEPGVVGSVRPLLLDSHPEVRATAAELIAELTERDDDSTT